MGICCIVIVPPFPAWWVRADNAPIYSPRLRKNASLSLPFSNDRKRFDAETGGRDVLLFIRRLRSRR